MSWLALLLVPLALYAAYKLVGVALKLVLAVVVLVAAYWWAAPQMGWPTVSDLVYVFGPDLDGRRIEEVADPSRLAGQAVERVADHVAEEVAQRSGFAQPEADQVNEVALPLPDAAPEADPEAPRTPDPPM